MRSNNVQSVRYYLKGCNTFYNEIRTNAEGEIELAGDPFTVQIGTVEDVFEKPTVFVDILDKPSASIWKFKLYLSDGTVVKECYGIPHLLGHLVLHNANELFDGRFNA